MSGLTPNYAFELIDFNLIPWDERDSNRWLLLDRILSTFTLAPVRIKGLWTNATAYTAGDNVLDADTLLWYTCAVSHTSAATGNFGNDRLTNPSYWQVKTENAGVVRYDIQQSLDSASRARVRAALGLTGSDVATLQNSGFSKSPTGFILQWGPLTSTGGVSTIVYPTAFPTFALEPMLVMTNTDTGTANVAVAQVTTSSLTGCTVRKRLVSNGGGVTASDLPGRYLVGGW